MLARCEARPGLPRSLPRAWSPWETSRPFRQSSLEGLVALSAAPLHSPPLPSARAASGTHDPDQDHDPDPAPDHDHA
eukprot:CAMPEP_0181228038 /NCGR_PEP_ID=MMETSP1096-20121128/33128_1 /TAXON_ID=156174 ORGANISM="Chrysochromulina ericina, Strain CCMP281" /NCGR_SAMPLE_ID=MMETSP1096 /ASSEMBLY_ACC=CAM_ASM_000453 /LENGTH=76 /DNA_ID=CAMNT_0023321523 /DNA_START=899 /DNA_END=1127 /DNA_ORIENTATION=-